MSVHRTMKDEQGRFWVVRVRERRGEPARYRAITGPFEDKATAESALKLFPEADATARA